MNPIKVGAVLDAIQTKADRSVKLVFVSDLEMSPDDLSELIQMRLMSGWLIFAPKETQEIVIPDEPPPEFKNMKSRSQRLRDVLFVWWKQLGSEGDFEIFYRDRMEKLIDWVKQKLDPEN